MAHNRLTTVLFLLLPLVLSTVPFNNLVKVTPHDFALTPESKFLVFIRGENHGLYREKNELQASRNWC